MCVGDGQNISDFLLDDAKGQLTQVQRQGAIGNRARRLDAYDLTFTERLLTIITRFRLDTIDLALWAQDRGRQGTTRKQTTATQTDQQIIQLTYVFYQLFCRGALARNDMQMIVWRDNHHARFLLKRACNVFTVFLITIIANHCGAVALSRSFFSHRRIVRHDDGGCDT